MFSSLFGYILNWDGAAIIWDSEYTAIGGTARTWLYSDYNHGEL